MPLHLAIFNVLIFVITTCYGQSEIACVGVPNGRFVRNSHSCRAYYYCLNEVAHNGTCDQNFSFNPKTQVCDHPGDVDCLTCSEHGIQNIAHPFDCGLYYRCVAGNQTLRSCSDGLMFDREIGNCNFPDDVKCDAVNPICSSYAHIAFIQISDPNDCSKFFSCINGVSVHRSCAYSLYFNPTTMRCERLNAENSFCQAQPPNTPAPTASPTQKPPVVTQPPVDTQPPPIVTQPPNGIQPPLVSPPITFPPYVTSSPYPSPHCKRANGYHAIPGSCKLYIYCMDYKIKFEFNCDEYFWNQETETCVQYPPPKCEYQ